jgi:uncharacterized protein
MTKAQLASCLIGASLAIGNHFTRAADPLPPDQPIVSPADAISRLKEGNGRFSAGTPQHPHESIDERKYMAANSSENAGLIPLGMTGEEAAKRRAELTKSQHPFAIILSCSDSRVPPEIVFDQGLGDLFGVRVAGNVLNNEGLGSIEYAVDVLGARLIVVLGHQSCGAVDAAMKTVAAKGKAPGHIQSLVAAIKPVVDATPKADLDTMIKANVKYVVDALRSSKPILKAKVDSGDVQVIGAYYTLDTGAVTFSRRSETRSIENVPVVGTVESLWRYPVKSMRGEELEEAFAGYPGMYGDRVFAFKSSASPAGFPYFTAREQRRLLLYRPHFRYADKAALPVNLTEADRLGAGPLSADVSELMVDVETPGGQTLAVDDPALIELLLNDIDNKHQLTLMRSQRPMTDCRPVSILSLQSARQLSDETDTPIDKRRFRANVYLNLESDIGFGENEFVGRSLKIGPKVLVRILERDARCAMITLDPDTAERTPAVLKKVAQAHEGTAGVYGAIIVEGVLHKGDAVELLD